MHQVYAAYDIIAACAGMPYGVADAVRMLPEVERPILVVCVEKFSDKIGNVRTSRMIFGEALRHDSRLQDIGSGRATQHTHPVLVQTHTSGTSPAPDDSSAT